MRVIAGKYKGKKLVPITGKTIRPTADRTKEAIFNVLGQRIQKNKVLDLFAGTAAMGIEALSRGAYQAVFVDHNIDIISQNIKMCALTKKAMIICCDIMKGSCFNKLKDNLFDLVFIDPPYNKAYLKTILNDKAFYNLIKDDCIIVAEHLKNEEILLDNHLLGIYRQKKYANTMISFLNKI